MSTIKQGNAIDILRSFEDETFDCCVTSPPYWGLRDYGTSEWVGGSYEECTHKQAKERSRYDRKLTEGSRHAEIAKTTQGTDGARWKETCPSCGAKKVDLQLGLEKTPEEYVAKMVEVFREVRRVLKKDGTLWLNLGDSYANNKDGNTQGTSTSGLNYTNPKKDLEGFRNEQKFSKKVPPGLKQKDLVGIPWRVAFALQADGWYLRQDIIWAKPNPMPESVTDRCTKAHEYVFLLSKSQKYYFDNEAIKEVAVSGTDLGILRNASEDNTKMVSGAKTKTVKDRIAQGVKSTEGNQSGKRNKRSVWTVTTKPFKDAHFATFPEDLIIPMIKAGCRPGGTVLDPFFGAGTTGVVAEKLGRTCVGIELNGEYIKIAEKRLSQQRLL